MRLLKWFLDLLYPPKCAFCGDLLREDETDICRKCRLTLPKPDVSERHGEFFESCRFVYEYKGAVAASIRRYKFRGMRQYAPIYGRLLAMELLRIEYDVLTWVPVSDRRRRKRGYDQSYLFAQAVAKELGAVCVRTLRKKWDNRAQSSIRDAAERRANVLNVYAAVEPENFADKRVLLIDDMITTGATLSECSRVLLTAGAAKVFCATLASTQRL